MDDLVENHVVMSTAVMQVDIVSHALVGLGPVLCFLAALLYLDSYKLVPIRTVITIVACGLVGGWRLLFRERLSDRNRGNR